VTSKPAGGGEPLSVRVGHLIGGASLVHEVSSFESFKGIDRAPVYQLVQINKLFLMSAMYILSDEQVWANYWSVMIDRGRIFVDLLSSTGNPGRGTPVSRLPLGWISTQPAVTGTTAA
jgi:hypothetical protein